MTVGEILNVQPYNYLIHKHDNKFKVQSGEDGSTQFETVDDVDAFEAFEWARDNMAQGDLTVVKNALYPFENETLIFDAALDPHQTWQALGSLAQIRPLTNIPAIQFTNGAHYTKWKGFYMTHNQSGYDKNLIDLVDRNIEVEIDGCRFYDFGQYKGNAVGLRLATDQRVMYKIKVQNCWTAMGQCFFYINHPYVGTVSTNFITAIDVNFNTIWPTKRIAKFDTVSGSTIADVEFLRNQYQYIEGALTGLTAGEAIFDFGGPGNQSYLRLTDNMIWDFPAGTNLMNLSSTAWAECKGTTFPHRAGGSGGISKIHRFDWHSYDHGVHTTPAVLGQRDYTITHRLGVIPEVVSITMQTDENNFTNQFVCEAVLKTSTTFVARVINPPIAPGTLKFGWRAWA